jgi:hypothetical protein
MFDVRPEFFEQLAGSVQADIQDLALPRACPPAFLLQVVEIGNAGGCPGTNDF